jgi:hypothetical protein
LGLESVAMNETPSSPEAAPPKDLLRLPPGRWIREAVVILVSVALGFAASEFGQYRQERGLAASVLRAVRAEAVQNEAALSDLVAKHEAWRDALAKADATQGNHAAYQILIDARPEGDSPIGVPLKNGAWQMAVSSGALRLLDFEVAQALSEIYALQTLMTEHHNRFVSNALFSAAAFDPATSAVATKLLWGVLSEVAGNEQWLLEVYRKNLPVLQRASAD